LPVSSAAPISDDAVTFMAATVAEASSPVVLVAIGPLTNVARYLAAHGADGIARIVLMGGAIAEGNFTPAAEFNMWCDPEAAAVVFASGLDVTMIGLDVTHQALLGRDVEERLRAAGRIGSFVADLNVYFTRYHHETYGWDGAPVHDAVAIAHLVRPELVETRHRNVAVELESNLCRGRTVVDLWGRTGAAPNAHVGIRIDADSFFDFLVERIATLQ
jgi:inosine-uridine nucleoside N-ribohydrolase